MVLKEKGQSPLNLWIYVYSKEGVYDANWGHCIFDKLIYVHELDIGGNREPCPLPFRDKKIGLII